MTKLETLVELLDSLSPVAIGYSGGVDSAFLAAVCARRLPDRAALFHLVTPLAGTPERVAYERDAQRFGLPLVEIELDPLALPQVAANPTDRCYHCKQAGFALLADEARRRGYKTVVDGSNADDAGDFRPGMRALAELSVHSPLLESGWRKQEERELLRTWGLEVWNLPAGACLATRIPCGEPLTAAKLELVRACEDELHACGLTHVRARLIAGVLHIQMSADDLALLGIEPGGPLPADLAGRLRKAGAARIDPAAHLYAHGSMNSDN